MPRRPRPAHRLPPTQEHNSNQGQTSYPKSKFPFKVCVVKSESESEVKEGSSHDSGNYEDIEDSDNESDEYPRRVAVWEADNDFEGELIKLSNEVGSLVNNFYRGYELNHFRETCKMVCPSL